MSVMKNTARKLAGNIAVIILLSICLAVSTLALASATISSENNLFSTGIAKINLNGGEPVITETEFLFEPGMMVEKEFFIENVGTCDVWYRLYFSNLDGGLSDALDITVYGTDGSTLYSGKMTELVLDENHTPAVTDTALAVGEKRVLKIRFAYPEEMTSESAGEYLNFDIVADAVQTKNNDAKSFD